MTSTIREQRNFALRVVETPAEEQAAPGSRRSLLLQLRLTAQFHASLDLTAILAVLAREAELQLGVCSIAYAHPLQSVTIQVGSDSQHHCTYELERHGQALGELRFGRRLRFTHRDLEKLETVLTCLVPALSNALEHRAATQAAIQDELTGCGNRTALELCAAREIAHARRHGSPCAMLVIDCDHFKEINDRYGHSAGDAVLTAVGDALRGCSRDCDGVFRYGGEEFVMLLGQSTVEAAAAVAERVRTALETLVIDFEEECIAVTASIGVAALYLNETLDSWFRRADQALYRAKAAGRNRVALAPARQLA